MGWNTVSTKDLGDAAETKGLSPGSPVAFTSGVAGRPYKDGWNIERAYRDGVSKVTWVFRAIDAIAGNQAKLPLILREDNTSNGKIIDTDEHLLHLLNSVTNIGESSFAFRYRVSSQLLMSTRGVFIEVVRNRSGGVASLHLLPPQHTAPIPHPKTFVSGYEVEMPNGGTHKLKPQDVIWIRRPHPLDPYRSITPLEAAGVAIEVEQLAKMYNRNFLLNDGRPGGMIVLRGEIDPEDKEELENRFRGNIRRTGSLSVIASDDGADFIDTGSNPRDIAYAQMRAVTKEEILASFGVPESIIGNASGRTFSNAAEEGKVFWQETMSPHLELISRSFDQLHDTYYVDFDTSSVPVIILGKQEGQSYLMQEFSSGLITANEYRRRTGREPVESELADGLLANPSLTPIGNTEKPTAPPGDGGETPVPGAAPGGEAAPLPIEVTANNIPVMDSSTNPEIFGDGAGAVPPEAGAGDAGAVKADPSIEVKESTGEDIRVEIVDWEKPFESVLGKFFKRQRNVVLEKARSKRTRRALADGTLTAGMLFDDSVWDSQLEVDMRPLVKSAISSAALKKSVDIGGNDLAESVNKQVERVKSVNASTVSDIAAAVLVAKGLKDSGGAPLDVDSKVKFLLVALGAVYVVKDRQQRIAANEAATAYNSGLFISGVKSGATTKTWVTRNDDKVRSSHRLLSGESVPIGEPFKSGGYPLMFPGDPSAPPEATIGCRCVLVIGSD